MTKDEQAEAMRQIGKTVELGAAYGMGTANFTKSLTSYGETSRQTAAVFVKAMRDTLDMARFEAFSPLHDEWEFKPAYKEETIMQHRFGERKPHTGKRLYRLWIDGVWVGDFKSKAERRKVMESTQVLMEEPEDAKPGFVRIAHSTFPR